MDKEKKEGEEKKEAPPASEKENKEDKKDEPPKDSAPQDPVKKELENIDKGKKTFSKRERLNFEKKKIDEQLGVLDEEDGIAPEVTDDTPVTVGMLNKREKEDAKKTSLSIAETINDEDERKLTIHYLENRIKPSGDPEADVKFARAAVNSLRNGQIAEEMGRKKDAKSVSSPSGNPPSHEKAFKPTDQERVFMNPPYNLTKEDVIKSRERSQASQG